jgi:hypothetical protein
MITAMMIEPNASKPTNLPEHTYPPKEGIDKNNTYATVPRIMDQNMILDTLSYPRQSSITALRTYFGIAVLAGYPLLVRSQHRFFVGSNEGEIRYGR